MKKLMMLVLSVMLVFGTASAVLANDDEVLSPTGTPNKEEGKKPTAPKTGENDAVIYALASALLMGGCAVVARKRLEA